LFTAEAYLFFLPLAAFFFAATDRALLSIVLS